MDEKHLNSLFLFNIEIQRFQKEIEIYQRELNVLDKVVVSNLKKLIRGIMKLVENAPTVKIESKTILDIEPNIEEHGIRITEHRQIVCKFCNFSFGCNNLLFKKTLNDHLGSPEHNHSMQLSLMPGPSHSQVNGVVIGVKDDSGITEIRPKNTIIVDNTKLRFPLPVFPSKDSVDPPKQVKIEKIPLNKENGTNHGVTDKSLTSVTPSTSKTVETKQKNSEKTSTKKNKNGKVHKKENVPAPTDVSDSKPNKPAQSTSKGKQKEIIVVNKNKKITNVRSVVQISELPKATKRLLAGSVMKEVQDFIKISKPIINKPEYKKIKNNVKEALRPHYPNVQVYFYGSRTYGLGYEFSDLDLYVDIDNLFNKTFASKSDIGEVIARTKGALRNDKEEAWLEFDSINSARTPILKAYNHRFLIDCDFSFSNGLGVENSNFIKYLTESNQLFYKMCVFIKLWGNTLLLSDHNLKNYPLILCVLFYLQAQSILPSIYDLQKDITPIMIGPWQTNFDKKNITNQSYDNAAVVSHIREFFLFMFNIDFETFIICPLSGKMLKKMSFAENNTQLRYKEYTKTFNVKGNKQLLFAKDKPMCVQDPFDLSHNVTKGVSWKVLETFKQYCKLSHKMLINK